jgi:hypothetical protein
MRFDLLTIGPAHDRAEIRFHPRLTVVGGMAAPERADFAALLIGAVTGTARDVAGVRWVSTTGAGLQGSGQAGAWRWTDDAGVPQESLGSLYGLDDLTLRRLMLLSAGDLAVLGDDPALGERPELLDARSTLASIETELSQALAVRATLDALHAEVTALDDRLRNFEKDGVRRRHSQLVAELERVRLEAMSLQGGAAVADDDRRFIDGGTTVRALAERWRQARHATKVQQQRFGDLERLDERTLAEALATPEQVPPELEALAAGYEAAEAQRALLADRLDALATDALPKPSHPAVVRLAHADQDDVWSTARLAIEAGERLERESLALGGLQAEGVAPVAASDLETAHDAVELAQREVRRRQVPGLIGAGVGVLLSCVGMAVLPVVLVIGLAVILGTAYWSAILPARDLGRRRTEERDALQRAGVVSHMAFQLRRLDVHLQPKATEPLELAALEYRRAIAAWRKRGGEISPSEAMTLEGEARAYAAALAGSRGAADEIAHLREQLASEAEPNVATALGRLVAACAPFGIDDPELAVQLVRHQAGISTHARLQATLEEAEHRQAGARRDLEAQLSGLGFAGTPTPGAGEVPADDAELDRRLDAFEQARTVAEGRERARASARPLPEVEADLARLEAQVAGQAAPEWEGAVDITDGSEADVDSLRARRRQAAAEYELAHRTLPNIERLSDRREAVQRRVAVLGGSSKGPAVAAPAADLEDMLLGRLTAARRVGPSGEGVAVVLDEPFGAVHGDRKWSILDAVERLSASTQLIYLTDDVDVLVWARRRSIAGSVSLLEPTSEPAG